jgi:hypothetical protein
MWPRNRRARMTSLSINRVTLQEGRALASSRWPSARHSPCLSETSAVCAWLSMNGAVVCDAQSIELWSGETRERLGNTGDASVDLQVLRLGHADALDGMVWCRVGVFMNLQNCEHLPISRAQEIACRPFETTTRPNPSPSAKWHLLSSFYQFAMSLSRRRRRRCVGGREGERLRGSCANLFLFHFRRLASPFTSTMGCIVQLVSMRVVRVRYRRYVHPHT